VTVTVPLVCAPAAVGGCIAELTQAANVITATADANCLILNIVAPFSVSIINTPQLFCPLRRRAVPDRANVFTELV
jgi:hypothetical protein